ncbi:hypothetical protein E4H12_01950 [Candidatus Thorarchaeota archaeon]|nr:MAG: hypothetical protein E4H12_01950 [Candidatus Thorarchaeota archaeon]
MKDLSFQLKGATVTLTDKQATDLYNAWVGTDIALRNIKPFMAPNIVNPLRLMLNTLDPILNPLLREQLDKQHRIFDAVDALTEERGLDASVGTYACRHMPDKVIPHAHATTAAARFVIRRDVPLRGNMFVYKSEQYLSPTYGDAFTAFCESIKVTGDTHHIFFENVIVASYLDIDGEILIDLISGS